jgi:exodeoxyribonuclease VII large subunit
MAIPIRLSQLGRLIQEVLQDSLGYRRFWVLAEVSNHSFYAQKGFHYFDLVEKESVEIKVGQAGLVAKIPAVAWTAGAIRIRDFEIVTGQAFKNNIQILAEVSVDYHPVYGLKLTLLDIDASFTLGNLELAKQATIERLLLECPDYIRKENGQLQTFNQELLLPPVIQRIAVISSQNAAGYEDFLHSLEENSFGYRFLIEPFFTTVQGETNAAAVGATLQQVEQQALKTGIDFDAVVIIRGGGASTDLLLFDQFEIAKAVAACPFPVITGIGHQKNETIADLMAHTALKTPTRVAEFILQVNRTFETAVTSCRQSIIIGAQQHLHQSAQQLSNVKENLVRQSKQSLFNFRHVMQDVKNLVRLQPILMLSDKTASLRQLQELVIANNKTFIRRQQMELEGMLRLFRMASPEKVLRRGFALIEQNGKLISTADSIEVGDELKIILSGTEIGSTVHSKKAYDGKPFDL